MSAETVRNSELFRRLAAELDGAAEQKRTIMMDALWKFVRGDYHGVMDCAADMRELHL